MSTTASRRPTTGLYGSTIGDRLARATAAETVGTAVLVYAGTSVAVVRTIRGESTYDLLAVVLTFGIVLVALVAALGHVSGCHLNPAITVGLAATGRFPRKAAAAYVAAQLVGGLLGALATWVTYGDQARSVASLGASLPADGVPSWRVFIIELMVTFLVLVVISVATDERAESAVAPLAVGAALAAAIAIAAPQTGGAVNPARAFGPDVLSGNFGPLWIYLLAPTLGGLVAAVLYDRVLAPAEPPA